MTTSARIPVPTSRGTIEDLRRRAASRLADRIDFTKSKHKPISLVRAEAKRVVEQFLDLEAPALPATDREKVVSDVVGEAVGLGPLEELFRDESIPEFMILGPHLIIARKGDNWLPTSVRFADAEHYARTLAKVAEQGERSTAGPHPTGGFDVVLPNGFRATAVLPPAVLEQPPLAVFLRCPAVKSGAIAPPAARAGTIVAPAPRSAVLPPPPSRPAPVPPPLTRSATKEQSGAISFNAVRSPSMGGSNSELIPANKVPIDALRVTDPFERLRQRCLQRLIERLSAAGIYDVSAVPTAELYKVIAVQVVETAAAEKIYADQQSLDRLTQEILAGMQR